MYREGCKIQKIEFVTSSKLTMPKEFKLFSQLYKYTYYITLVIKNNQQYSISKPVEEIGRITGEELRIYRIKGGTVLTLLDGSIVIEMGMEKEDVKNVFPFES